jgi:hypothetical protein
VKLADVITLMRQHWPFPAGRSVVLEGYLALGDRHQKTLTDICLRNYVFSEAPGTDAIALAIAEGRRRCALEIAALARADRTQLYNLLERKPERGDRQ